MKTAFCPGPLACSSFTGCHLASWVQCLIHQKVLVVQGWKTPTDAISLYNFLGFAPYYRCYIHQFANIAAPFHHITSKGVAFYCDTSCFKLLKSELINTPILFFPDFRPTAPPFHLLHFTSSISPPKPKLVLWA